MAKMSPRERLEAGLEQLRREALFRDLNGRWPTKAEARKLDGSGAIPEFWRREFESRAQEAAE